MKKIALMIFILFATVYSQQRKFFDVPMGLGGGYTPRWSFVNVDPLNQKLKSIGFPELSANGIFTSGGTGFIYVGFIPNLRIGGMGYGGSTSESNMVQGVNNEVQYTLSGGGFTAEYTLPFIKNIGVSVGAIIGGGSLTVEFYRNSVNYSWQDFLNPSSSDPTTDISPAITNSYWFLTPTLNIDIPFYNLIVFRIGAGYQLTFADEWTIDNNRNISGIPSDFNANNFYIQAGILIGFFSF